MSIVSCKEMGTDPYSRFAVSNSTKPTASRTNVAIGLRCIMVREFQFRVSKERLKQGVEALLVRATYKNGADRRARALGAGL